MTGSDDFRQHIPDEIATLGARMQHQLTILRLMNDLVGARRIGFRELIGT